MRSEQVVCSLVSTYLDSPQLYIHLNSIKPYSGDPDMLNFDFLEKHLVIDSPSHFLYDFSKNCPSCYILLSDQILLSKCLYCLRYWGICVLKLFVNQVVSS